MGIVGADGRMGRAVRSLAQGDPRFHVAAELRRATPLRRVPELVRRASCLIDFSLPAASLAAVRAAAAAGIPAVVGTTGFSSAQTAELRRLARRAPILLSANMSPGMNVLLDLVERAARALPAFDAGVWELHHRAKRDAPSGSARLLAGALALARPGKTAPIASLRAGDIVGDHTVLLAGPLERLELSHRAHSREVFARGALDAALWLSKRRPGLFSMREVLGL